MAELIIKTPVPNGGTVSVGFDKKNKKIKFNILEPRINA